jgi:hypothetical protein
MRWPRGEASVLSRPTESVGIAVGFLIAALPAEVNHAAVETAFAEQPQLQADAIDLKRDRKKRKSSGSYVNSRPWILSRPS